MLPVYPVIIFPILCIIIAGKNQQQQWGHQELSGAASCVPAPAKGLTSRFHRCHRPGLCFADHYHRCGGAMEIQGAAQHQDLWWVCRGWRSPFLFTHIHTEAIHTYTHVPAYTHWHGGAMECLLSAWTDSCAVMCSVLYQRYSEVQWIHTEVDVLIYLLYREILEKCQYHIIIVWKTGNIYWWL